MLRFHSVTALLYYETLIVCKHLLSKTWVRSDEGMYWASLRLAGLASLTILVRFILHKYLFKPFSKWRLGQRGSVVQDENALKHKQQKLSESLWKASAYSCLVLLGVFALYDKYWALKSRQWWSGYPHYQLEKEVAVYYNAELAFYGGSLVMLIFWEERRQDYYVMLTHHIVTVALISLSQQTGFGRVGSIVMLLHDPSDVFLELAKAFSYLGFETASVINFTLLLISWGLLRLIILPAWLIRSTIFELPEDSGGYPIFSSSLIAMLCSLVCMHIYWFALIVRIAWRAIVLGETKDTREDDD